MQRFFARNKALFSFIVALFFSATIVFAGNPGTPILPSDNIQDPGALSTPWGGCGPTDSNCYVTTPAGGTASLSSLTAATVDNTIDNADFTQEWQWNSLSGSGLKITSNSTAASGNAQKLFEVALSGANALAGQTTYAGIFSNTHTGSGTNVGLSVSVSGGADNYAALFNGGVVGIGTTTPDTSFALDVNGTTHLNNRLYIGPLPENYSPAFINVSSFATKNTFVNSVFSLSSTETGSPTYPTQLIFAQEGATVGWSLSSVNQGVAYSPIILNPYGGAVLIGTKTKNADGILQVEGNIVPSINASFYLGSPDYEWANIYATSINGTAREDFIINGGNTVGAVVAIGTNDTNTLSFRTDGVDRVVIDALGSVGIGDTTPDALFTVGSTSQFQVNASGAIAAATGITSSGTVTFSSISGSTQCLQVNASGVVSGTGSACGSGGGVTDGDKGDITVSGGGASWSVDPDVIDWADIADATTLDASTSIGFGASTNNLTFNNDGSGNLIANLSSTGDFVVQNNGAPFATFDDAGRIGFGDAPLALEQLYVYSQGGGNYPVMSIRNGTATEYTMMGFLSGTYRYHIGVGNASESAFGVADDFFIYDSTSNAMRLIVESSGDVNIGGDGTPDALFTVGTTSQFQVNASGAIAAATGITSTGILNFTADTTTNSVFNMTSTGDFIIQDGGSAIATFADTGAITFAPASNQSLVATVTGGGFLSFNLSGTGGGGYNLTSTGDFVMQDNGSTFLTISDTGAYDYTLDATDNPNYSINNLGGGDVVFRDNGNVLMTLAGDGSINLLPQGAQDINFTLDDDSSFISTGTVTSAGQLFDINLTLGNNAAADVISGINIDATSVATGDADILYGINIGNLTGAAAVVTETALRTGTGWEYAGIFESGNVGIGDTSPAALLTVGSGDLFQVNASGAIAAATGITSSGTVTFSSISGSTQCLQVNASGVVSGSGGACGGGGTPSLTSTRIAFGDASNLMTSSSKLVFNDNLYPTLVITGSDPLIYIGPSGTLTNNPAFGSGSGAAIYGGATYKSINFYDQISGGAMLARFYSGSGTLYNELKGLVVASTLSIPSNFQGAYTIQRTYPYAVTGNNGHGYTDQTIFQTGAAAFNSFGSFVEFGNSASSQDHYAAFQNVWKKSGTNTMSKVYGFVNAVSEITGGTITDLYGYYHYSPTMTSGTITNQYAIYVPAVTGATNNWSIYSESTPSYHGGEFRIGSATDLGAYALQVTGDALFQNASVFNAGISVTKTGSLLTLGNTAAQFTNGGAGTNFDPVAIFSNTEATGYTQVALEGTGRTWSFGVGNTSEGSGLADNFFIYDYTGTAVRMLINSSGFVGIGDLIPDYLLDVANAGADTNIFALTDSDGECLYNPESGAVTVTCSSDERLKANIVDTGSALAYFRPFKVREYNVIASGDKMIGVIAQEVLQIHPEIVTTGANGMYSVQLPNQWQMVKAIQELDVAIQSMQTLTEGDNSFVQKVRDWLADINNGINKIFAKKVETEELCLNKSDGTQLCLTADQLQQLLGTPPSSGSVNTTPVDAPIVDTPANTLEEPLPPPVEEVLSEGPSL